MASSKMTIYMIMMSGITLLLYYGGMITNSNNIATLLNALLNIDTVSPISLYTYAKGTIAIVAVIGISASLLFRPDLAITAALTMFILDLGLGFVEVFAKLGSFGGIFSVLAVLLFSPLILLFFLTVMEWWRGIVT